MRKMEDPIVCYLVVRELGMSAGKTAAQCAHAVEYLMDAYWHRKHQDYRTAQVLLMDEWKKIGSRKVVLTANEKEWAEVKKISEVEWKIVRDCGLTELEPGTETVIGLFPLLKSNAPKIVKKLQTLK